MLTQNECLRIQGIDKKEQKSDCDDCDYDDYEEVKEGDGDDNVIRRD